MIRIRKNKRRWQGEMRMIEERTGNSVARRKVKRETMAVRMAMVGLRGYYGMKAINGCEGIEEWIDSEMENCVSQSMKLISPGPPSPVESLIKSPCWGFRLLPDGTTSLYMSCLAPDQHNYDVLWEQLSVPCVWCIAFKCVIVCLCAHRGAECMCRRQR